MVIFVPLSLCGRFCLLPVTHLLPKSRSAKKWFKKCTFWYIFAQNARIFDKKDAKKCKKTLIFTLIFHSKTNKSYNTTLFNSANHPIFQNFPQKLLFLNFFLKLCSVDKVNPAEQNQNTADFFEDKCAF